MKSIYLIFGLFLLFPGAVFLMQGIKLLPGSFMTGRPEWAIIGAIMSCAGLVLVLLASRQK